MQPKLGQWCIVSGIADKCLAPRAKDDGYFISSQTVWVRRERSSNTMMFIGRRIVKDGVYQEWDYGEDGTAWAFRATKHHEVWLFVKSASTKPVYVFPCDVKWEDES